MSKGDGHALAVAALIEQLGRQVQVLCFTRELAPVQWSALRFLAKAGPSARTVSGLAAYSGVNLSSASRTVQLLIGKGLIRMEAPPEAGRRKLLSLTANGHRLLARDPLLGLAAAVRSLQPEEQASLSLLLERVLFSLCPKPFQE